MTTLIIEHIEPTQPRLRTREQAARLLEELRDPYQALSRDERDLVRGHLLSKAHKTVENEEL
jgi:hypothetical protein